jgi:hypothetical protein
VCSFSLKLHNFNVTCECTSQNTLYLPFHTCPSFHCFTGAPWLSIAGGTVVRTDRGSALCSISLRVYTLIRSNSHRGGLVSRPVRSCGTYGE